MKKMLAVAGACALALSLSACGGGTGGDDKAGADAKTPTESASTETKTPEVKPGLISTTEDVAIPDQEGAEETVDDADALEDKWEAEGKAFAEGKGIENTSSRVSPTFASFDKNEISSYRLYLNANDDWKTGDKIKVTFYCQTVEPANIKVWIAPQLEDAGDDQPGQLSEVACGVDSPAEATWEYTLPADTSNLMFVRYQVPIEGFMITDYERI